MCKYFSRTMLTTLATMAGFTVVEAQFYYQDSEKHIEIKKSLLKAVIQEISPAYLNTIETAQWQRVSFYQDTNPIDDLKNILDETSSFVAVNDPLVFDGDKITQITGEKITDIPGSGVVVYDGRTAPDETIDYREYQVLDGDKIWVEQGHNFNQIPPNKIIVYDCLFPPVFNCGNTQKQFPFQKRYGLPTQQNFIETKETFVAPNEPKLTQSDNEKIVNRRIVRRIITPDDPEYQFYKAQTQKAQSTTNQLRLSLNKNVEAAYDESKPRPYTDPTDTKFKQWFRWIFWVAVGFIASYLVLLFLFGGNNRR